MPGQRRPAASEACARLPAQTAPWGMGEGFGGYERSHGSGGGSSGGGVLSGYNSPSSSRHNSGEWASSCCPPPLELQRPR